ncbi:MAG: hypothetical protein AAF206_08545 [Bacteroidota bacterium]
MVKYSLYIPSQYSKEKAVSLMVALRPGGNTFWSAKRWRDVLKHFAETHQMLLLCPENGQDGRWLSRTDYFAVDQAVDSIRNWYQIADHQIFIMGFGEGALAAIKSNIRRPNLYRGLLIIGNTSRYGSEFGQDLKRLAGQAVMLIHGKEDHLMQRFHPLREALMRAGARVDFQLVDHVGHQYPFPQNPHLLANAMGFFRKDRSSFRVPIRSAQTASRKDIAIQVVPQPIHKGSAFHIRSGQQTVIFPKIRIYRRDGVLVKVLYDHPSNRPISSLTPGVYDLFIQVQTHQSIRRKVLIKESKKPSEW